MESTTTAATRAVWAGAASLAPYAAMKTYWAFGGTAGRPAGSVAAQLRENDAPEPLIWLEEHGVDFTVLAALAAVLFLVALARFSGTRLPRWCLLVPGWTGALLLTPYGLATMIAAPLGFTVGDAEGWSWWVGLVGGLAFFGLGIALGVGSRAYQRRTRREPSAALA